MAPPPWRRHFAGLFLAWFATLVAAPAAVHRCPVHDLPPVPATAATAAMAPMAAMGHGHGAEHQGLGSTHDHSPGHEHHHCNCLDASCAAAAVALPESGYVLPARAEPAPAAPPQVVAAEVAPDQPGLRLPYPNAPPPLA